MSILCIGKGNGAVMRTRTKNSMKPGRGASIRLAAIALALCTTAAQAQLCSLSMQVTHTAAQQLTLSDVDFEHFQGTNLLFTINLSNNKPIPVFAVLHLTIDISLADNSGNFTGAVELTTQQFQVPPGGRTITNMNLGSGGDIKSSSFRFDDAAKSKIQDVALVTGHLPAGTYTIHVALTDVACAQDVANSDVTIVLTNPTRVALRSPREGEVTNEFPLFEFYQEGDRAVLTVAELQSGQYREDAIEHVPPMLQVELTNQNSFLYSGGRPLEDGKSYVWNVVSKIRVAGGTDIDVPSPIGEFSVSSSLQGAAVDALLLQLEEMLGSRYHDVFEQIRNGGFRFTGDASLNDAALTQSALLDLLNQLRQISDTVDLTLE